MDFKTKIKEAIKILQSKGNSLKILNFNELEESELYILEEIYYFNELKKNKLNSQQIKSKHNLELINDRFNVFNNLVENEKFKDIDLNDELKILFNDTFIKLIDSFYKDLNIDILKNIKSKIEEQEQEKNIILTDDKKSIIYKKGIKHFFYKYTNIILNNQNNTQQSENQTKNIKHLQSYNNMVKLENIIKEMNQSGGNMNLVNLFKILNNVYVNKTINDIEKERLEIYIKNINFNDEINKEYIKKYLNFDDSEKGEISLNKFIITLKKMYQLPELFLNKIREQFNQYLGKEVDKKELSNRIFQLDFKQKEKFNDLFNDFSSEVLEILSKNIGDDVKNEVKSLLKIYIENNLHNMCDDKGNLRSDLKIIEILKDINNRTFKITPEKEYKKTGKILKNVFDFSNDTPPIITFNKGGRGELDIIYYNDFNFIGCSTTINKELKFEGNQLLNHPYKLYKLSETLDFDENVDIKKILDLLKQDSRTKSFDKEFDKINWKLETKKELRTKLFQIKNSKFNENIDIMFNNENVLKKIFEEINYEFHFHSEEFYGKEHNQYKDFEKHILRNLFMSALLDNNGTFILNPDRYEKTYEFLNRMDKSFKNYYNNDEKDYNLDIKRVNNNMSELLIYSITNKDLNELKDNEILKLYKDEKINDNEIKNRISELFKKNSNYFRIIITNLTQYLNTNKQNLDLLKDLDNSLNDFDKNISKLTELANFKVNCLGKSIEREEKLKLQEILKQNGIEYPGM